MCGIFGIVGSKNSVEIFAGQSESIRYRGPDDFNSLVDSSVDGLSLFFAHSRLVINGDLNRGKQPVKSTVGNIMLYNGEIFDFNSNNDDYEGLIDTERLFTDLEKNFNLDYFNSLNGFFAIAFYNRSEDSLYLIRDRFGEKPLYYQFSDENLVFSSIGKGVKSSNQHVFSPFGFIKGGGISFDENFPADGINQIPAGHYLKFVKGRIFIEQWYKLSIDENIYNQRDFSKLVDDFDELLKDACRIRIADLNEIAVSISGGVDSTLVLDTINLIKAADQTIVPFTFSVGDMEFNELNRVNKTISKLHISNLNIVSEEELTMSGIDSLLRILEFPSFNLSIFGYNAFYSRVSNTGHRVILEGHGPDEILGGYAISHVLYIVYCLRSLKLVSFINALLNHKKIYGTKFIVLIKNVLWNVFDNDIKNIVYKKNWELFSTTSLPNVLRTFDRIAMFNNLESRSPFLDYRVVRFLFSISPDLIFYNNKPKSILLHLLSKRGYDTNDFKRKIGFTSDFSKLYTMLELKNVDDRSGNFNSAMRIVNNRMEKLFNGK